ncbi:Hypothetical predicted protein [Pelobates cultripes]|uniref:Uncharacterized protein n=1 Tax=Pelobates cultripes TaxID=61616 RepID=A0AAD1RWT3_PELCU|nr:Hypothetical predicted protein [Pelobates cultripes]
MGYLYFETLDKGLAIGSDLTNEHGFWPSQATGEGGQVVLWNQKSPVGGAQLLRNNILLIDCPDNSGFP